MMKTTGLTSGTQTRSYDTLKWLPILMYHHVVPRRHPGLEHVEVSVAEFEQQMRYLKEHRYQPIHLDEATRTLVQGKPTVDRPVVITFDDGYLDVFLYAFPILEDYRFTAEIFLVSSHVEHSGGGGLGFSSRQSWLGTAQVEEMAAYGMSFGSHSITHRRLVDLNQDEAWDEIRGSKAALEHLLELPVDSFSFPHGCSNAVLREMTREAGYLTACGIEQREHELYNLSRIDPSRCRGADVRWKTHLSGLYFNLRRRDSLRMMKHFLLREKPAPDQDGARLGDYARGGGNP